MWTEMDVYDNAFYICWCNLLSTEREQNTVGKKEEGRGGKSAKTFFPTLYFPRYLSHSCSVRSSLPFPLPLPTLTFFLPSLSSHSLPFSPLDFFPHQLDSIPLKGLFLGARTPLLFLLNCIFLDNSDQDFECISFRAKNKLDSAVYAVKKVFIKINKEDVVLKILREVTVLAKVIYSSFQPVESKTNY